MFESTYTLILTVFKWIFMKLAAFFVTVLIFDFYILIEKYIDFELRSNLNNKVYMNNFLNILVNKVRMYIFY